MMKTGAITVDLWCILNDANKLEPRLVQFSHFCQLQWIGSAGDKIRNGLNDRGSHIG